MSPTYEEHVNRIYVFNVPESFSRLAHLLFIQKTYKTKQTSLINVILVSYCYFLSVNFNYANKNK